MRNNKKPYVEVQSPSKSCWEGWNKIADTLNSKIKSLHARKIIITVECYQGTYEDINLRELKKRLPVNATCTSKDVFKNEEDILKQCEKDLAGMPFSVKPSIGDIEEYFDNNKLNALRQNIDFIEEGVILIFGVGASKIYTPDILVYADMSRWEIAQRFKRNDVSNIGVSNHMAAFDKQYWWGYFIDWKICDKLKKQLIGQCDYFLETNNWEKPKLATGDIIRHAIDLATKQPFFTAPFYDPELWESSKQAKKLKEEEFSWVFNCVAEENNVLFKINGCLIEIPSINIIYAAPQKLLGKAVYSNFGSELPIRILFMDSLDNTQEVLYAYPGIDFLKDNFGFYHSQSEVFYVMDTKSNAKLRLGFKQDMTKDDLYELMEKNNTISKPALEKHLHTIPLQKHDFLNIPERVVHSHGSKTMILKVSSAPEIFSFKLPTDIIDLDINGNSKKYNTNDIRKLLSITTHQDEIDARYYNHSNLLQSDKNSREETLNQENDQLTVKRVWFKGKFHQKTNNSVQVLNLVEGDEVVIESPDAHFEPFIVHFAESFIIPATITDYTITPSKTTKEYALLKITI